MDALLTTADTALRTLFTKHRAATPYPPTNMGQCTNLDTELNAEQRREVAALMRVNHVGEVCAQALYTAQALTTRNPQLRTHFTRACIEETDHLAWTEQRLHELDGRTSLLNPLWYAGAFGIGLVAGRISDAVSLGFVVETEVQVGAHLQSHLDRLPENDHASRAIVSQMRDDELRHAQDARDAGALELPQPIKSLMRAAAKVMTTVAHRI
ncbi:MAG: 2-polyprenyl-3-methyl-6-methoxy,4-benzoquinone monooxygenase [Pseudomonadota bacterium]